MRMDIIFGVGGRHSFALTIGHLKFEYVRVVGFRIVFFIPNQARSHRRYWSGDPPRRVARIQLAIFTNA